MKTMLAFLGLAALVGAALYLYLNDLFSFAMIAALIAIFGVGAAISSGGVLAHHREADARRKNKEDLPLYYKDKGDEP